MRVVLVDLLCNSPFYCGELTRALCAAGVDAELASPRFYLEPDVLQPVPRPSWIRDLVVHASRPRPVRLVVRLIEGSLNLAGLLRGIRRRHYDVVHVQWVPIEGRSSPFMQILRSWCDRAGTLLVYTAHNAVPHDAEGVDRAALQRDLDCAHLVIAQTEHIARQLRDELRTRTPVVVIPHGPLFTASPLPSRGEATSRLGVLSEPVVLFQGLIRPYKGLDLLADAWPAVQSAFSTASLRVVGKVADEESSRHVDRVRRLEHVEVIDRYVSVPEMLDCYAAADLVVFPYRRISQSGALMTAVGLGRPTVVTPIDGFREQLEGLRSPTVADAVDAPAIGRALITALGRLGDLAAAASEDRRTIAMSPSGWAAVAASTTEAYAEARRGRSGA